MDLSCPVNIDTHFDSQDDNQKTENTWCPEILYPSSFGSGDRY